MKLIYLILISFAFIACSSNEPTMKFNDPVASIPPKAEGSTLDNWSDPKIPSPVIKDVKKKKKAKKVKPKVNPNADAL